MRKYGFVTLSMLVLSVSIYSGNGQVWAKDPQIVLAAEEAGKAPRAVLKTKFGEMEIVFFPELAPKHVKSFLLPGPLTMYLGRIDTRSGYYFKSLD